MDFEQARYNMIEQQIRPWEVLDQRTLDLFEAIHREDFMPPSYRQLALADINIPLPHDQVTMTPKVEARLLQALALRKQDRVLEVGTGCAFVTALLGCAGGHVDSVDIFPEYTRSAQGKMHRHGLENVALYTTDAARGWGDPQTYDAIAVTGSVPILTGDFQRQLRIGGRLFIIVGRFPVMEANLIIRVGEEEWRQESLFETEIPPLVNAPTSSRFRF